jgi:hypothetical protein
MFGTEQRVTRWIDLCQLSLVASLAYGSFGVLYGPRKLGLLPSAKHDPEKLDKFCRLPSSQPKLISPKQESEIPVVTSVGMDKILLHHLVFLTKVTCARFLTTQRDMMNKVTMLTIEKRLKFLCNSERSVCF